MDTKGFISYRDAVIKNCGRVIVGKDDIIELVVISFLCDGHVLLEDVPGTGKTMLLRAFSKTIGGNFRRVHSRPAALRFDGHQLLQSKARRVRVPCRPALFQHRACRRDKQSHSTHSICFTRGYGGTADNR